MAEDKELESTIDEPKEKRGRKPGSSKPKFSDKELMAKHERIFNIIAYFLKVNRKWTEEDFIEESKDLGRIANEFEVVGTVIKWLDPVFYICGVMAKTFEMMVKKDDKSGRTVDKSKVSKTDTASHGTGNLIELANRAARPGNNEGEEGPQG
jgi:hypothetical protein